MNCVFASENTRKKSQSVDFFYVKVTHLGNVQVIVSDKRKSICDEYLAVDYFEAEVLSAVDYYPFGMMMPDRQWYAGSDSSNYRFGFSGQEKDNEVAGVGNSYTAEFWQYDSRLGRRFNVDPKIVAWESPYACFRNNPIFVVDICGDSGEASSGSGINAPSMHSVQSGESPSSIAKKHNISLEQLALMNREAFSGYLPSMSPEEKAEYWKNSNNQWVIHPGDNLRVSMDGVSVPSPFQTMSIGGLNRPILTQQGNQFNGNIGIMRYTPNYNSSTDPVYGIASKTSDVLGGLDYFSGKLYPQQTSHLRAPIKFGNALVAGITFAYDYSNTDFSNPQQTTNFVQNTIGIGFGAIHPAVGVAFSLHASAGKDESSAVHIKNMERAYSQSYMQQNAYIYRNFIMRNQQGQ